MLVIDNVYEYMTETVAVVDMCYNEDGEMHCVCAPLLESGEVGHKRFAVPELHADKLKPIQTCCNGCLFHSLREEKRKSVLEYKLFFSQRAVCLHGERFGNKKQHLCAESGYVMNGVLCPFRKDDSVKNNLRFADIGTARSAVNAFFVRRTLSTGAVHKNGSSVSEPSLKAPSEALASRELTREVFDSAVAGFKGGEVLIVGNYPALLKEKSINDKCIKQWYDGVTPIAQELDKRYFDYDMYLYLTSKYPLNVAFIDGDKTCGIFTVPTMSFLLDN